jgi:hypothetical protein
VITHNRGPTGMWPRSSSHGSTSSQARSSIPTLRRRPPLPRRTAARRGAGRGLDSVSASASWMRSPARHKTTIDARKATPVGAVSGSGHDGHDLGDRRRISRIALALVAWRAARVDSGHRRRRTAAAGGIEHNLRHARLLRS